MGCTKEIVNYLHTINWLAILVVRLKLFLNRKKILSSYPATVQLVNSMDAENHEFIRRLAVTAGRHVH